jgi:hypothetical protein
MLQSDSIRAAPGAGFAKRALRTNPEYEVMGMPEKGAVSRPE